MMKSIHQATYFDTVITFSEEHFLLGKLNWTWIFARWISPLKSMANSRWQQTLLIARRHSVSNLLEFVV